MKPDEYKVFVWSPEKGVVGSRPLVIGDRIEWSWSGWGKPREYDGYCGTVIGFTAKKVRVTLDTGTTASRFADPPRQLIPTEPFTICVSPRRLSLSAP